MTYTEPLLFVFLSCCLASFVLLRHSHQLRRARRFLATGILGLFLTTWRPAAWLFSRPLESPFPKHTPARLGAQAIVVPGSDFDDPQVERPYRLPDRDTYGRCRLAAWLYHAGPPLPVLVSGHWATGVMREILESDGVPAAEIWEEKNATTTHENALYSARMLRRQNISTVLVVSEGHSMLRVQMCFQKERLAVVPAIWVRTELTSDFGHLLPRWESVRSNEATLHEVVGLIWYRLRGWI